MAGPVHPGLRSTTQLRVTDESLPVYHLDEPVTVRYIDETACIVEKVLACSPMYDANSSADALREAFESGLARWHIPLQSVVSVSTDNDAAQKKVRFVSQHLSRETY